MKIILHGILAERFGREHEILTTVPAEAIEGLSRQFPDWPRELLIDVLDFQTEVSLRSHTDVTEIHLVPSMHGGGGVGKIIIGVALIAAVFLLPAVGVPLAAWASSALFAVGASMMMMGVSELLMAAPVLDKGSPTQDPPASKYLGINKNTAAIGTLIIMAWGRMKLSGHWLSLQSDSNDLVTTSFPTTTS